MNLPNIILLEQTGKELSCQSCSASNEKRSARFTAQHLSALIESFDVGGDDSLTSKAVFKSHIDAARAKLKMIVHFVTNLSLLPRATIRVFPVINWSFLSPNQRLSTVFYSPQGSNLKFLQVPSFINSDRYICAYIQLSQLEIFEASSCLSMYNIQIQPRLKAKLLLIILINKKN